MVTVVAPRPQVRTDRLGDAVVDALIDEALLTPKPGLVDGRGGGSHDDMSPDLMVLSAQALRPTFRRLAQIGAQRGSPAVQRVELARAGCDGELVMLEATGGVNTHRGAIWALGLAVAATAGLDDLSPQAVLARVAAVAAHDDPVVPAVMAPGAEVRLRHGVGGAPGAARAGFPLARRALRAIRHEQAAGAGLISARLDGLLVVMQDLDDTCLLRRGGAAGLALARVGAATVLRVGGASTAGGWRRLVRFDRELRDRDLSPGGSADMLALALFLDAIDRDGTKA